MKYSYEYRFLIYVDYNNDGNWSLAAWYDYEKQADKEARFLQRKGRKVKVVQQY